MAEVTVYPNSGVSADESRIESTHAEDFVIVDEEPLTWRRDQFPLILHAERIYGFSISNCVIATLLIMTGFASIYGVPYFTSDIAFPVWCGTMVSRIEIIVRQYIVHLVSPVYFELFGDRKIVRIAKILTTEIRSIGFYIWRFSRDLKILFELAKSSNNRDLNSRAILFRDFQGT